MMSNGGYGHGRGMGMELLNRWRVGCGVVWAMWRGSRRA
jgi:hypothetical protein